MSLPDIDSPDAGDADWRAPDSWSEAERPLHWSWLVETGSLTERIAADFGAPVDVELISERREPEDGPLVREVRLHVGRRPVVYAVSRIPATLIRQIPWLAELGDRPMGERLFEVPGTRRERLQLARLDAWRPLVQSAFDGLDQDPRAVWARTSSLALREGRIAIIECFLGGDPG